MLFALIMLLALRVRLKVFEHRLLNQKCINKLVFSLRAHQLSLVILAIRVRCGCVFFSLHLQDIRWRIFLLFNFPLILASRVKFLSHLSLIVRQDILRDE